MYNENIIQRGVKQGSSALPAYDLHGNKGKAVEAFALPLRNQVIECVDPAEAGRGDRGAVFKIYYNTSCNTKKK